MAWIRGCVSVYSYSKMSWAQKYANVTAVDCKFYLGTFFVLTIYDEPVLSSIMKDFKYLRHVNVANDTKIQDYFNAILK